MICIHKGLINSKKEIEKLSKKQEQLIDVIHKIKQAMEIPDYNVKVPLDVQNSNMEKLTNNEGELQRIIDALSVLRAI